MVKDYVKKQPTQRKQSKETRFPWKLAFIGLIFVIGLILLIIKLNDDPEPTQAIAETEKVVDVIAEKKAEAVREEIEEIPPPPEEQWGYMQTLEDNEITVVAKEVVAPKIPYILQCGAYKDNSQAQARKARIALKGVKSKVVKRANSNWYRVVLGPYPFSRDATKDMHTMQRAKMECFLMRANAF